MATYSPTLSDRGHLMKYAISSSYSIECITSYLTPNRKL